MKVLAFDLNTNCTGVFCAEIDEFDNDKILKMMSIPLISTKFKVSDHFDYENSKKKMPSNKTASKYHNTYWIKGEEWVSEANKKKRDIEIRRAQNKHLLNDQIVQINYVMSAIGPDIVLAERNETFNGILTIELLAKVYGQLMAVCSINSIELIDYSVVKVRSNYNVPKLTMELSNSIPTSEYMAIKDKSKAAIAMYLEHKYAAFDLKFLTYDESDAAVLFDHWRESRRISNERRYRV